VLWIAIVAMLSAGARDGMLAQAPAAPPAAQSPSAPVAESAPAAAGIPPNAHFGRVMFQDQPVPGATIIAAQGE
jgi:hypothetical protein